MLRFKDSLFFRWDDLEPGGLQDAGSARHHQDDIEFF